MSPKDAADGHEAQQTHEEIAHAAGRAPDIRHLREHDLELLHNLPPNIVEIGDLRALAQQRFGKIEPLKHAGLHCGTMCLVIGMNFSHGMSSLAWSGYC